MDGRLPGIYCKICGARMEPERGKKRRWRFVCPECGERTPPRDGRAQAARAALTYDALAYGARNQILCPYWVGTGRSSIKCESPCAMGRHTGTSFSCRLLLERHMIRFCRRRWADCPIARENEKKAPRE